MGKFKLYINGDQSTAPNNTGLVKSPVRGQSGNVSIKMVYDDTVKQISLNGNLTSNLNPLNIKDKLPAGVQALFDQRINAKPSQNFAYIGSYDDGITTHDLNDGYTAFGQYSTRSYN